MVAPISSLANMEYALYGGASLGTVAPSYSNGYMGQSSLVNNSYYNPYGYGYGYGNYNNTYPSQQSAQAQQSVPSSTEKADWDILAKNYMEGMEPSESLLGAAGGGAAFALITNQRFIAHPWNSLSTIGKVEKMFKGVKQEGSVLNELWKNPETHKLMTDAYARMHKLEGGAKSRLGLFKARLDEETYKALKGEMERALASGDKTAIATATEKIRVATNAKTGYIPRGWAKVKGWFGGNSTVTPIAERTTDEAVAQAVSKNLAEKGTTMNLKGHLKHGFKGAGGLGGLLMMGMEFLFSKDKIAAAFNKDSSTGWKQVGQTTIKGAGSLIGWTAGEAVGAWAGAKLGAMAGTAIAPGVGTVIGAIAGLVGGSIGCWAMGKLTKKIVGEEAGDKALAEQMKNTDEGKTALLQYTIQKYQQDGKLPVDVQNATSRIIQQYQVA